LHNRCLASDWRRSLDGCFFSLLNHHFQPGSNLTGKAFAIRRTFLRCPIQAILCLVVVLEPLGNEPFFLLSVGAALQSK
jgi:hypothetical protein